MKSDKSKPKEGDEIGTWDMEVMFKGSGYASGHPFIVIEQLRGRELPILGRRGFLGFDFKVGITLDEAKELIRLLNERVELITYTGPRHPEWIDRPDRGAEAASTRH